MNKILAIDDNNDNLFILEEIILEYIDNIEVITSNSGIDGIRKAEVEQPDVILLDIRMPEIDGFEVCELLKNHKKTKNIPIIMLTAIDKDSASLSKGLGCGADAFLRKPINNEELIAQVKVALRIKKSEDILRKDKQLLENELNGMKSLFEVLFNNLNDAVFIYDNNKKIQYINPAFSKLTGYSIDELYEQNFINYLHPDDEERMMILWEKLFDGESFSKVEFKILTKNGKVKWSLSSWDPIYDIEGNQTGVIGRELDITKRKSAEEKLEESLKEKNILIKEIHHRVKNNLQVISSLLGLQCNKIKNQSLKEKIHDIKNRINSIAFVHELLYKTDNFLKIDFSIYIKNLLDYLYVFYKNESKDVQVKYNINKIFIDIDTAIPCGILINEIVTNIYKHAFKEKQKNCKIYIEFAENKNNENSLVLVIKDNGKGLPEDFNLNNINTFGFQIISGLIKQINGKIEYEVNDGTQFKIFFNKS